MEVDVDTFDGKGNLGKLNYKEVLQIETVEEFEETILQTHCCNFSDSICSLISEERGRFSGLVVDQISRLQTKFNHQRMKEEDLESEEFIRELIQLLVQAMDDISNKIPPQFGIINDKLSSYQRQTNEQLYRRKKRMQNIINLLTQNLEEIEENWQEKSNDAPDDKTMCSKLLKMRGIIDELALMSQKVGATEKEVALSSDLSNLAQCLEGIETSKVGQKDSVLGVCESVIIPQQADTEQANIQTYQQENNGNASSTASEQDILATKSSSRQHIIWEIPLHPASWKKTKFIMFCFLMVLLFLFLVRCLVRDIEVEFLDYDEQCNATHVYFYLPSIQFIKLRHYTTPPF